MLLQALRVTNSRGSILDLPLEDISGGFIVKDIQGLGPVKATLVSSSFANMDGAHYHSSRRDPRNLIIKLGLEPDWATGSVQELRAQLYDFFMPKTQSTLRFRLFDKNTESVLEQNLDVHILGTIESCEPAMFARDPELDISIMCFNPDFVDLDPVIFEGMSVSDLTESLLSYAGSVETGVIFTISPDRAMPGFDLYHRTPDDQVRHVDFTLPLLAGDVVKISSVPGSKYATLTRAGVESAILYAISPQSPWFELFPGDNQVRVHEAGAPVPYQIEYTTKYGGL
jgi:hypothetical protein